MWTHKANSEWYQKTWVHSMHKPLTCSQLQPNFMHMEKCIFMAEETNTAWNPTSLQTTQGQFWQVYVHNKMAISSNQDKASQATQQSTYQPGGTLMLTIGKWANHIINWGHDTQLGQWSYMELMGQYGKQIIVVLTYFICSQQFDTTSNRLQPNNHTSFYNKAELTQTHANNLSWTLLRNSNNGDNRTK